MSRTILFLLFLCIFLIPIVTLSGDLPSVINLNVTPGTEASPVVRVYGNNVAKDTLGSNNPGAIAFGDINGDGYDDLVIGSYTTDKGIYLQAGMVYVVYGGETLPTSIKDLYNTPGTYGETRIYGYNIDSWFGYAVACGDLNGDGKDDIIIGSPAGVWYGQVYIVYGDSSLQNSTIDLGSSPGSYNETYVRGGSLNGSLGYAVASGDVNSDGYDDFIIGDPDYSTMGRVYVFFGSVILPGQTIDLGSYDATYYGGTRITPPISYDGGCSVASGDVNGDGFDDVLFGVSTSSASGLVNSGEAVIVYGSMSLPGTIVDLYGFPPGSKGETCVWGYDTDGRAGYSVDSGDINGDGYDDVIVGAPYVDLPAKNGAGETYLIFGSGSIGGTVLEMSDPPGTYGEVRFQGDSAGFQSGWSVAAGDINGDGFEDTVIGAEQANEGITCSGIVYVVYGQTSFSQSTYTLDSTNADVRVLGDNSYDYYASAGESGGDLDRDGFIDIVAAAYLGDNTVRSVVDTSYAVAVFGDGSATNATVKERFRTGNAPMKYIGGRKSSIRALLSFQGGDNGSGGASETIGKLYRSDAGISNLGNGSLNDVADAVWEITTNRVGFTSASLIFQYLDSEVSGLVESSLRVYQAPAFSGPWTKVSTQSLNTARNEITSVVSSFSYFAILDVSARIDDWNLY